MCEDYLDLTDFTEQVVLPGKAMAKSHYLCELQPNTCNKRDFFLLLSHQIPKYFSQFQLLKYH